MAFLGSFETDQDSSPSLWAQGSKVVKKVLQAAVLAAEDTVSEAALLKRIEDKYKNRRRLLKKKKTQGAPPTPLSSLNSFQARCTTAP